MCDKITIYSVAQNNRNVFFHYPGDQKADISNLPEALEENQLWMPASIPWRVTTSPQSWLCAHCALSRLCVCHLSLPFSYKDM